MKTHSLGHLCCAAFAWTFFVGASSLAAAAPMVIQPVSATSASNFSAGRADINTVNATGLSDFSIVQTGDPIPVVWPTHGNVVDGSMWHTANLNPGTIVFDLGAVYDDINGFHVWNFNENSGAPATYTLRGMQNVTVSFSTAGAGGPFTNPVVYSGATAFLQADGSTAIPGEDKFFPTITARWVQFVGFRFPGAESYTGLSEIRFFTTYPVPEPSTFALLGLGVVGFAVRRRRRSAR